LPWLIKGLLLLSRSRTGRRLMLAASLATFDLAKRTAQNQRFRRKKISWRTVVTTIRPQLHQ
jgi:hypothetical protein